MERSAAQLDTLIAMVAIITLDDLLDRHPAYRSSALSADQRSWALAHLSTSPRFREAVLRQDTRALRRLARQHLHLSLFARTGAQL